VEYVTCIYIEIDVTNLTTDIAQHHAVFSHLQMTFHKYFYLESPGKQFSITFTLL